MNMSSDLENRLTINKRIGDMTNDIYERELEQALFRGRALDAQYNAISWQDATNWSAPISFLQPKQAALPYDFRTEQRDSDGRNKRIILTWRDINHRLNRIDTGVDNTPYGMRLNYGIWRRDSSGQIAEFTIERSYDLPEAKFRVHVNELEMRSRTRPHALAEEVARVCTDCIYEYYERYGKKIPNFFEPISKEPDGKAMCGSTCLKEFHAEFGKWIGNITRYNNSYDQHQALCDVANCEITLDDVPLGTYSLVTYFDANKRLLTK